MKPHRRLVLRPQHPTMARPAIRHRPGAVPSWEGTPVAVLPLPTTPRSERVAPAPDSVSEALEALVRRFGCMLQQVGRQRGLTDAEAGELCQEVRIRLWHALASGERIAEAPASYVYRTALSAALDMIRRRCARREEPLEGQHDTGERVVTGVVVAPEGERALEREELGRQVSAVVDGLSEPRDVVVRMYLAGYNHREIAELLGWTEAKARNLLYRGLADVRAQLTERGIGPGCTA